MKLATPKVYSVQALSTETFQREDIAWYTDYTEAFDAMAVMAKIKRDDITLRIYAYGLERGDSYECVAEWSEEE